MDSARRRDAVVRLLRRGNHVSVESLAFAVSASRRTVLRDLVILRDRGYAIETAGGPGGGVRMDPGSVMVSGQLAADEVVGLVISVAMLRSASWMPFSKSAEHALAKIEGSLPPSRIRDLRRFLKRVLVGPPASQDNREALGAVVPELLDTFERAFGAQLVLALDYQDREGRASHREVEPQALLVRAPFWYVVGWDTGRDAMRTFRMDRISRPRVLETRGFALRSMQLVAGVCPDSRRARVG